MYCYMPLRMDQCNWGNMLQTGIYCYELPEQEIKSCEYEIESILTLECLLCVFYVAPDQDSINIWD